MFRNKPLAWAFAASLVINIAFLVLVGNSDIFQHADVLRDLRAQEIRVYKPPIPQKPKPKPKLKVKPPPPPKPKPSPPQPVVKQKPVPPPPIQPKPVVKHVAPPPRMRVAVSTGSHVNNGNGPAMPTDSRGQVGQPTESVTPPPPNAPAPPPQPKPEPAPAAPPQPKPEPAPAPPPPAPKPKPAIADRMTPEIIGSWNDFSLPGDVDMSTITNANVHATWDVDTSGHARDIKFDSSGNDDVDDAIRRFIRDHHYEPAVQNGIPQDAPMERDFNIGQ